MIERVGAGLLIHDRKSKNGTFHALTAPRDEIVRVQAGDPFWLGDVGLVAMDGHLEVLRPHLARRVGLDRDATIDRALGVVAAGGPLALVGRRGLGAVQLAAAIHAASPQRGHFFLRVDAAPVPSLEQASGGTVVVDLDQIERLAAAWLATLVDPARGMRPIFVARSERQLWARLAIARSEVATIVLVPLAQRPEDIVRLLAIHWIEALRSGRRLDELGRGVDAIARHTWPRNLDELYEQSPRLLAYLEHGTLRAAAGALGITHQTLAGHFQRIGFRVADRIEGGS